MCADRLRPPTIDDVAERCGVATSTVSRAFSHPGRVRDSTRELILATAAEMGYRPNPIARALPSGRTMTLGLLVPDITNPFFLDLIRGAERAAAEAGYTMVLVDTEESPEKEATATERLRGAVDGYLLASPRMTDEELVAAYASEPLVLINRRVPPLSGVVIDPAEGTAQAMAHLTELGHRRIAYLAGPPTSWMNTERLAAVRRSAARHGATVTPLQSSAPTLRAGADAAPAIRRTGATAVITFNAIQAIGVLQAMTGIGLRLPDQLSVIGYDDIFGADFCAPPLTTLTGPLEDAGRAAVDQLLSVLKSVGDPPSEITLQSRLTVRNSTGKCSE